MSLAHGQSFPYWQLFGINDPDNDLITKYEFMDATASATSGHFVLNGVVQPAGKAFSVLSADISTLSFKIGSRTDSLQVRVFDGTMFSAWKSFTVTAPVNHPVGSKN